MGRLVLKRNNIDGEPWRTSVCVNKSQSLWHQVLKKRKDGEKLEYISIPGNRNWQIEIADWNSDVRLDI